jgi:hypothetical protein
VIFSVNLVVLYFTSLAHSVKNVDTTAEMAYPNGTVVQYQEFKVGVPLVTLKFYVVTEFNPHLHTLIWCDHRLIHKMYKSIMYLSEQLSI